MIAAAVVAALALAACDSESADVPPVGISAGARGSEAIDPDREAPAAPIEGAAAGGTVTVLVPFEASVLSLWYPSGIYFATPNAILSGLVTRSLTQYVYDPTSGSMVLVPDIATDLGTPNADFTEWTHTIRDGVKFEDGTEVTADHVAFGIKRSFDRAAFPLGPRYSNDYFLDGEDYNGPYSTGTHYSGIVVEGDKLILKMTRSFPDMPYYAAFPQMGPVPEQGSNPATYWRHPLATGPYRYAASAPEGSLLTLVRNEHWDPDTDPGRHAYPDRYKFRFSVPEKRIPATILGDSEQAQTTLSIQSVYGVDYRKAEQLDRLTVGSSPCTHTWWPDYRKLTDIRMRQAIGYAYPYRLNENLYGDIPGTTVVYGTSILPPGIPGRQDYTVQETTPGDTDPDKAKELLREAGWAPGEYELTWPYDESDPFAVDETRVITKALEAAGFKARPLGFASDDDFEQANNDPDGPFNVRIGIGWCSDWPSGGSWFPHLLHSEGEENLGYFDEPTVDAEIERIGQLPIEEQPAEWSTLDKSIMTDYYPAITTYYNGAAIPHGARIGGMNVDDVNGEPTWKDIFVMR
ncbi:MAG: hypothetical protein H0V23_14885 [Nocardioidaceae bacterium]|nr:hypothetical protein [Nocardioidaceae bacterium]